VRNSIFNSTVVFYVALAALAVVLPSLMGSVATASVVLVFAIAAASCNLLLGYAGLLSFAQGSFFGVGSYVVGLSLKTWPGLGLAALPLSMAAGMTLALIIGALSIRQRGIYFVMITLAMAQLAFFTALSFPSLTGGENGLLDIPRPALGLDAWVNEGQAQYLLVVLAFFCVFAFLRRVVSSPFGKVLDATRENEIRAVTVGYNVQKLKLVAFCISGALTALAGALYALQLRSAPLSNIDLMTSETILVMAILGGRRSLIGAAFGALAMTLMAEELSRIWPRWQMIVGFVLIAIVLYAPDGLSGLWRQLTARFKRRPADEVVTMQEKLS
jgi:branched-chain amino acid transport system permease protein